MRKGFFDFILAADKEKIHSQIIGWILSSYCDVLSDIEKQKFLQCITNTTKNYKILKVDVERKDIDILIVCDDVVIIIENKIKSTEHSDQLKKYYETILTEYSYTNAPICIYLNLLNETASDPKWLSRNYSDLLKCLSGLSLSNTGNDFVFIEEYKQTIQRLLSVIKSSLIDPLVKAWVFEHHDTEKIRDYQKLGENHDIIDYLIECQLTRFVQKVYYKEVKDLLVPMLVGLQCAVSFSTSQREGEGLIQIRFDHLNFQEKGNIFYGGMQIQGNVCKINISCGDDKLKKDVLPENMQDFMKELKSTIKYRARNPPKTNAYTSVSKFLPKSIHEYSQIELAKFIKSEVDLVTQPLKDLIDKYYPNN